MTTANFDNWNGNMMDLGPLYPFVGTEWLMAIILLVAWIVWHIWQIRMENQVHEDSARMLRQGDNLHKATLQEHSVERM
jgi:hypothetical protein